MMDLLRSLSTLLIFVAFILLCIDVYRKSKKSFYDEAAMLPFKELESEPSNKSSDNSDNTSRSAK